MHRFPLFFASLALIALSSGCQWADDIGNHLPVIGERCEHWQCFTESGQETSHLNHLERLKEESKPATPSSGSPSGAMIGGATPPNAAAQGTVAPVPATPPLPSTLPEPIAVPSPEAQ